MNTSEPLVIQMQGLSKSYKEVDALKSLDLHVPEKSIFGFLGPNGAGKTTTIKLLLGLIKPTGGGGTVFGRDIVRESVDIRANVGYLPQDARFYEHMTACQTLDYTARFFYRGPQKEIDKWVDEMIELVGLTGKADRPIKGFSSGERQRLGIAQAEVTMPELTGLELSGGSHATITGFESAQALVVDASGASHLQGDIKAGDASFDLSGGSEVILTGSAQNVMIEAEGSSEVDLAGFLVVDANVNLNGGSEATVNPGGRLDVDASGASHVTYLGSPTLGKMDTSGSSSIEEK
jgi:ABC-type ATPase involved in cell division